jgi:hypothetical protein
MYVGNSWRETATRRSFGLILVVALTVAFLPGRATGQSATHTPVRGALGWEVLWINGNRDETRVDFNHLAHQEWLRESARGETSVCLSCHHLSKPHDTATPCWECHRDMFAPTSIFDHSLHHIALGGNAACAQCHVGEHTPDTAKPCVECHETMAPKVGETTFNYLVPGYKDVMHTTCITCHEQEAESQDRPELARCPVCHTNGENAVDLQMALRH